MWEYGAALAIVGGCTLIAFPLRPYLAAANLVMIYLIGVVIAATRLHRGVALMTSILSVAAFDFFCVNPYFSFAVAGWEYVITLAAMLAVALSISGMASRIREQQAAASEREARVQTEGMRTSLLSAVSHDLRTPLSSITGAAATLRTHWDGLDSETRDSLLDSVSGESLRLNRILNNLLEVTRLESGVRIDKSWFPIEEIVGAALHHAERQIGGRYVFVDIPSDIPMVAVDDVLIEQLLINLIENGLKHTPENSPLEIVVRRMESDVEIQVLDRGPGFAEGQQERVFDKYFRGKTGDVRGAGLGLAIARAIVEAHGGAIRAENRHGGGAAIMCRIPIGGDAAAELL